jgi:DNA-binding CsgD family transcriptional regulator
MKQSAFVLFFFLSVASLSGQSFSVDSALRVLDLTLLQKDEFIREKENRVAAIKNELGETTSPDSAFLLLGELFFEYLPYNTDSAFYYARQRVTSAETSGRTDWYQEALLNVVSVYNSTGMYLEAVEWLRRISRPAMTPKVRLSYYHLCRTLYGALADYSIFQAEKKSCQVLTQNYRDSIIWAANSYSEDVNVVKADALIAKGEFRPAINLLLSNHNTVNGTTHQKAIVCYTIADAWHGLGDREKELYYLALSSIYDVRASVREYISLWRLAERLFEHGDVERAYRYLQVSLQDATAGNARLRTIRISEIYPIIANSYEAMVQRQQQQLRKQLMTITLLAVILFMAVALVLWQMSRLGRARKALSKANERLEMINGELSLRNENLRDLNQIITENSFIKEAYIGRYMQQCSLYLDKMDHYRRWVRKMASGSKNDLLEALKSSEIVDDELREFYNGFDDAFLHLFPDFVKEFNALLNPNERVVLKPGELLNTELRIYALIRLGISDSDKIADFLRYSVSTIYNYRTKVRNKAAGERQHFEEKVMKIGVKHGI